jgi:hypothetical protein
MRVALELLGLSLTNRILAAASLIFIGYAHDRNIILRHLADPMDKVTYSPKSRGKISARPHVWPLPEAA